MVLAGIVVLTWIVIVAIMWIGWERALKAAQQETLDGALVSVVIPVRNEAQRIGPLLEDLKLQSYQPHEVIIVDDHSEDETLEIVAKHARGRVVVIQNEGDGKKKAVTTGVNRAAGNIIVTTDADCRVPPAWLEHLIRPFRHSEVNLVCGPVRIHGESLFAAMQAIEFSALIAVGAATAAFGRPVMCNGANLAYRKSVFSAVGGYTGNDHIPSGDDQFLLDKVARLSPGSIRFNGDNAAVVTTAPQAGVQGFLSQRIRWASKWKASANWLTAVLAVFVVAVQCAFLAAVILAITNQSLALLGVMAIKMGLEALFLRRVCWALRVRWNSRAFALLTLLYPFYVIAVAPLALLMPYRWKGRVVRP